jgi:hypothetical protein
MGFLLQPPNKTQQSVINKNMTKAIKATKSKGDATAATGGQTTSVTASAQAGQNNNQNTPTNTVTTESEAEGKFTAADKVLLQTQEQVIASNVGAFLRLGEALSVIKSRNLQKITDPNLKFEDYCSSKWGFGQAYAYKLIAAYQCSKHLQDTMAPNGVTAFPSNEAQVRPLTKLEKTDQVKAWSAVLQKANGGTITAAMVEEVVGDEESGSDTKTTTDAKAAAGKAARKTLSAIAKLVEKAMQMDPAEINIKKLQFIIEKIEKLLQSKVS